CACRRPSNHTPMTRTSIHSDTHDRIRVIVIDNPPVNAPDADVAAALTAAIDEADHDESIDAIVVLGAGRTFVAGADLTQLEPMAWDTNAPRLDLHDLLARVESSRTPVVMAMHGTALGGGLELAMAAHYRVAAPGTKL